MTICNFFEKNNSYFESARQCTVCEKHLPLAPRPVFQGCAESRILIIGQAPGIKAHDSATPWNDASGDRLRYWMGVDRDAFYNERLFALIPMGFCYPGKGKSGDLPPRPECAPLWHERLFRQMKVGTTLLIGQYAQNYYLKDKRTLTERVKDWRDYLPDYYVLPHPSPRNNIWLKKNPWFEGEVIPAMRESIAGLQV